MPTFNKVYRVAEMCRSTGYVFCFSDSGTGYKNHRFSLEQGIFYFRFDSGIVLNFP